jgi:hypothetical protein
LSEAGSEGIGPIMWLIMRAALGYGVDEPHRFCRVPASRIAVGHVVYQALSRPLVIGFMRVDQFRIGGMPRRTFLHARAVRWRS